MDRIGTNDGIPARVVAGFAAAVLLAGVVRWQTLRPISGDAIFIPTPFSLSAARTFEPEVDEDTSQVAEQEERPVIRTRRVALKEVESVEPVRPNRTFIPPPRKLRRFEPVRLDPPPTLAMARLEAPNVPSPLPNLQPPRRSPLRKFVSALAVPFRRI